MCIDKTILLLLFSLCFANCDNTWNIWPHPQEINIEGSFFGINPSTFQVNYKLKGNDECQTLKDAASRYRERMFVQSCHYLNSKVTEPLLDSTVDIKSKSGYLRELKNLTITIENVCEKMPHMDMDESYSITVSKEHEAEIHSKQVWGALRALETFSQMLDHVGKDQFVLHTGHVLDYPRFSHRGFLIDTSRHFVPVAVIHKALDALAMDKFNVLHWHIVDDQSFPFVSETFPELSKKGAYSQKHVYRPEDVKSVIEYARQRGIRVVVEFDTPGHTASWGKGQPGLLSVCPSDGKPDGFIGPINPANENSYTFLEKLFAEVSHRFPDRYTHLGGDEVDFMGWFCNKEVDEFMKKMKFGGDFNKLEDYYIARLLDIVHKLNMSYIVWQEVFDNNVKIKPDTIVHVWKGDFNWHDEMTSVTRAGYQALLSSCWYLNDISYGSDWQKYYSCDPHNFEGTDKQKALVVGGEACMWGEWVDGSVLISRTWPRASAVAEKLWSNQKMNNATLAAPRYHQHRCRMLQQGIRVSPNEARPVYCPCDYAFEG